MSQVFKIAESYKYNICIDLDFDNGVSYWLWAAGNSLQEVIEDAYISEVVDDGNEVDCYDLKGASDDLRKMAFEVIEKAVRSA